MISAVIPMFNEEQNCIEFSTRLFHVLEGFNQSFEIIFMVGGTDKTTELLQQFWWIRRGEYRIQIFHETERGLGKALKQGFTCVSSNADYVVTMDSDGSHLPEQLTDLFAASHNADLVIGCRNNLSVDTRSKRKKTVSRIANKFLRRWVGLKVNDFTSDFRLYRADMLKEIVPLIQNKNFEAIAEILIIMSRYGYKNIVETHIDFDKRNGGKSKLNWRTMLGYAILFGRYL